jgi:Flp pilus assembly protein CpaB
MNQWAFVIAAFAVMLLGTAVLLGWSWARMRAAERKADALSRGR